MHVGGSAASARRAVTAACDDGFDPSWSATYAPGTAGVDVCGNDPADAAWLDEFLTPWCGRAASGTGALQVRMIRSNRRARELTDEWTERRQQGPQPEPTPCIRLETRTLAFDRWAGTAGWRLADPLTGCQFVVTGRRVDVIAPEGAHAGQLFLAGMIREALTGAVAAAGRVLDLHAAAFAVGGQAIVLTGRKRAGKTSLLCHALLSGGGALIANDRVFVHLDAAPPIACGIPTVAALRHGTLDTFPRLREGSATFPPLPRLDGPADTGPPGSPSPEPAGLLLTLARLAGRLGAPQLARAPLRAILLPEIAEDHDGWVLERLPEAAAATQLAGCLHGGRVGGEASTFFTALMRGDASPLPPVGDQLGRLVSQVPVYRFRLGPDVYRQPATCWLHALATVEMPA